MPADMHPFARNLIIGAVGLLIAGGLAGGLMIVLAAVALAGSVVLVLLFLA
jgi:hypothetical protein